MVIYKVQLKRQRIGKIKFPSSTPKSMLQGRILMSCDWWYRGTIVHLQFSKRNETLNTHLYVQQLQSVRKNLVE